MYSWIQITEQAQNRGEAPVSLAQEIDCVHALWCSSRAWAPDAIAKDKVPWLATWLKDEGWKQKPPDHTDGTSDAHWQDVNASRGAPLPRWARIYQLREWLERQGR